MTLWQKQGFYNLTEGFWATRVVNELTTPESAAERVQQQKNLIDCWYPDAPNESV